MRAMTTCLLLMAERTIVLRAGVGHSVMRLSLLMKRMPVGNTCTSESSPTSPTFSVDAFSLKPASM